MPFPLNFDIRHRYRTLDSGIQLRTALRCGSQVAVCQAKVDVGSEVCLFQREIAETLQIDVESGHRLELSTLTSGGLIAYGHSVTLYTLEIIAAA